MLISITNSTYSHHDWCVYVLYPGVMKIARGDASLGKRGKYHNNFLFFFGFTRKYLYHPLLPPPIHIQKQYSSHHTASLKAEFRFVWFYLKFRLSININNPPPFPHLPILINTRFRPHSFSRLSSYTLCSWCSFSMMVKWANDGLLQAT